MNALLDTHAFVWAVLSPALLGEQARRLIGAPRTRRFISAASLYEMSLKVSLGKWPEAEAILADLDDIAQEGGYTLLAIHPTHAMRAGRLPMHHRDPFDRLLAGTALQEDYALCSADTTLDAFGVRRVW